MELARCVESMGGSSSVLLALAHVCLVLLPQWWSHGFLCTQRSPSALDISEPVLGTVKCGTSLPDTSVQWEKRRPGRGDLSRVTQETCDVPTSQICSICCTPPLADSQPYIPLAQFYGLVNHFSGTLAAGWQWSGSRKVLCDWNSSCCPHGFSDLIA